jgi:tRNA A37 threonylcarbamoyladenosine dehydratase
VSSAGAAGKLDPTQLRVDDLADAKVCPLARELRSILRKKHGFPTTGKMGVQTVFSLEHRHWPKELTYDKGEGFSCVCPTGDADVEHVRENHHSCDEKNLIDGTVSYVTGAFGLACASVVVNTLTGDLRKKAPDARSKFDDKAAHKAGACAPAADGGGEGNGGDGNGNGNGNGNGDGNGNDGGCGAGR